MISGFRALLGGILVVMVLVGCEKGLSVAEKMKGNEAKRQEMTAAIKLYHEKTGSFPLVLDQAPFLGEYLKVVPAELDQGLNRVLPEYDGKGGWFYNSKTGEVYVNVP